MESNDIKTAVEKCYNDIIAAKETLDELRKICKHEKTEIVNYEHRVGQISKSNVCVYCGEVIN